MQINMSIGLQNSVIFSLMALMFYKAWTIPQNEELEHSIQISHKPILIETRCNCRTILIITSQTDKKWGSLHFLGDEFLTEGIELKVPAHWKRPAAWAAVRGRRCSRFDSVSTRDAGFKLLLSWCKPPACRCFWLLEKDWDWKDKNLKALVFFVSNLKLSLTISIVASHSSV